MITALSLILTRCSSDSKNAADQTDATASAMEFDTYIPGEYPQGYNYADIAYDDDMSEDDIFAAYDQDNDPAHPVLDVKVELGISTIGSRPGIPRPDPVPEEYPDLTPEQDMQPTAEPTPTPVPEPTVTITPGIMPGILIPDIDLPTDLPDIEIPVLYITNPAVPELLFTGDTYKVEWKYTSGSDALFSVSISCDGGQVFTELASGLEGESYELTMPDMTGDACIIRVVAFVETIEYAYADTDEFQLVPSPCYHFFEFVILDRLDLVIENPHLNGFSGIFKILMRSQENTFRLLIILTHPGNQLKTISHRHFNVADDNIYRHGPENLLGFLHAVGCPDLVYLQLRPVNTAFDTLGNIHLVVNNQDVHLGSPPLFRLKRILLICIISDWDKEFTDGPALTTIGKHNMSLPLIDNA